MCNPKKSQKKSEQGSKQVDKLINDFKDYEFFRWIDDFMIQRESKTNFSSSNIATNFIQECTDDFQDDEMISDKFSRIEDKEEHSITKTKQS